MKVDTVHLENYVKILINKTSNGMVNMITKLSKPL